MSNVNPTQPPTTQAPDLVSLVLTLRPLPGAEAAAAVWWGRAAHALLLYVIGAADPGLAKELHEGQGIRPFTASTLMGRFPGRVVDPQQPYTLRLTAFQGRVTGGLMAATLEGGALVPGSRLEMDHHPFRVEAAATSPDQHPWAATDTYATLAATRLMTTEPPDRQIRLVFTSPTTFRSQERHVPIPLPELVFGSLLDRWNDYSPLALPAETKRYAVECLAVSRYDLATRQVPAKEGGMRVGAVGQITYTTLNYDRYWMSVLHTLATFALFSGVGAATSSGLGQCRQALREA